MNQFRASCLTLSLFFWATLAIVTAPTSAQAATSVSIENLPADMTPDPAGPGSFQWFSPKHKSLKFDKIMLEPVTIYVAPDSKEKGLDPDALKSLSDTFAYIVVNEVEPAYPVVNKPGRGVVVLRPALTNVYLERRPRGLLSFTPVGMVVYAARDAHSKRFSLQKASLEIEALDGASGERLAIMIVQSPEKSGGQSKATLDWSALERTLTFFAQRMKTRLDERHGK